MQYMLLIYGVEKSWHSMPPAEITKVMQAYESYSKELAASGALRGGSELAPIASATTVRVRNGKVSVTDGPFAETKEQLAGFYMIEARDLNEAIQIASKIPPARVGCVEVRPIRPIRDTVAEAGLQKQMK